MEMAMGVRIVINDIVLCLLVDRPSMAQQTNARCHLKRDITKTVLPALGLLV